MLLQFNFTNFRSFRDEAILSMEASKDKSHKESLITFRKENILPCVAIYGANASGKSNIFKALTFAIRFIRSSNERQIGRETGIAPFAFRDNAKDTKSRFDFVFTTNDVKYEYGFVCDSEKVYDEYLYAYKSAKPSRIFEREDVNKYSYPSSLKNEMKQYEDKNTENKLFLATATAWNCEATRDAYNWFEKSIDTYTPESFENMMAHQMHADNGKHKEDLLKWIKQADFNISGFDFSSKMVDLDPDKLVLPPGIKLDDVEIGEALEYHMNIRHAVETSDGHIKEYQLPIKSESKGTLASMTYVIPILYALEQGRTITIDEIDTSLHPMLVRYIIEMFLDPEINKNGAQLLFNTHDVTLLDLDLFRRDQIYFVEKNNKTGASDLYSLDEFSPRKSENIRKGYLQGRYGAIPAIGGNFEW